MKRFYNLIIVIMFCTVGISGQEFDVTFTGTESGTQTHVARNSVTLEPGYTYTPGGGTMSIEIQNPVVTGSVTYTSTPVDPETRSLNTSYMVGATDGSLNVNASGGASYTIPLEMLPGVNGLAPGLSLVYSSNSSPGIAGYGWQISGLSGISRGPKNYYYDGKAKGIDLDTTDRFYLDGQRLVTTNSSAYGNASAEYQTDNDNFTRVKQYGTNTYGPAYFKAETKSGVIFEYGNTTGSKQKISGYQQVVNWYVSKISDLFGNQVNIAYLQDDYNVYPAEITYGPNAITFYYKERNEKNPAFFKGIKMQQKLLLDKITIKYNTTIVKTYELKYNYAGSVNLNSLLNEIVEYGIGTNRINSTAITYFTPENVAFNQTINNTTSTDLSYQSRLVPGDFNGDGKEDIFCFPASGECKWRYYENNWDNQLVSVDCGDFSVNESLILKAFALDINGDNNDDLIFSYAYSGSTTKYYYVISDGLGFGDCTEFASTPTESIYGYRKDKLSIGDIDGDGFNDFIIVSASGEIKVYSCSYSNGQVNPFSLRSTLNFGTTVSNSDAVYLMDFNGDGKADIWKINAVGIKIYSINGSSLMELYSDISPQNDEKYVLGDFNGDGKSDILSYGNSPSYWLMKLSNGIGFEAYTVSPLKANLENDIVRSGDFNGDGCTDLMVTANADNGWTGHYYFISKNLGTDFYSSFYSTGRPSSDIYQLGDFDGDGRDDYLCTDGASPWTIGYKIFSAPGNTAFLMNKVANGLGYLTKIYYTKLSQANSSVFDRSAGASFPVIDYEGPLSVVSSIQYDNGKGTLNTKYYYYTGIKIHRQGKGFLGFTRTIVSELVNENIIVANIFDYDPVYYYMKLVSSSSTAYGGSTFETTVNTWSHKILSAAKKRIFPYIQSSVQTNNLTHHSLTITFDYDNYGNPTTITKGYNNGVTETTTNTYNNTVSTTQWLLGRPTATNVQYVSSGNTITRSVNRTFNSINNNLLSETVLPGNSLQLVHGFKYNNNTTGTLQRDSVTSDSSCRINVYMYETNGIRITNIRDPLMHLSSNIYDTYGRLWKQQDYLNNLVTYVYDNMHRQASVTSSFGSSALTTYAWQNPTSTPLLARYSVQTNGNDGSQTKIWYDMLGREIRSDVKGFEGTLVYTTTEYNTKGQLYRVSEPYLSGTVTWNTFTYDNYGRKTGLTTPSGRNSAWQYTGNTATETTAGKTYTKTYAADGTLTTASDAGGTISYTYFPDGKAKTITAPGGIITTMQYDIAGNQTQLVDPSAKTLNYTYNGFGELLTQVNGRNQTTSFLYYNDGRPLQKLTPEGRTSYSYNANKQLTKINSPNSISRSYGYYTNGKINTIIDTISTEKFLTTFTYDSKGRLYSIAHPSGITERNGYNSYGYLSAVGNGSATLFETLNVNARGQMTRGRYGSSLETNLGYNDYGFPNFTSTGSFQYDSYEFNSVTGNLNSRTNPIQNMISENFEYDNLNRLDRVYRGGITLLDMTYESNKGGIILKSDVGTLNYGLSGSPYALSSINPSSGLTPNVLDSVTYTSFESVNTLSEGTYKALFTYNSDNERAKMVVQQNNSDILTRWYPNSRYIKETAGGVTKEYTFIGGDAYSAPVVAIKQNGTTTYYNLLRDHLGSITRVVNASNNSLVAEYSYDAWGRMRDKTTWVNYAPGSEPSLFVAGRGFTGHEHLPWFNLIDMNGRVYDPLNGQFLSADNYVQAPGFTQSFNRYGYCLNNPLKYTDPSGELFDIFTEFFIGLIKGCINSGTNPLAEGLNQVENGFKVIGGLFAADTKQAGWGWQIVSRFTWEAPQTAFGFLSSDLSVTFGNIQSVDYYAGATVLQSRYEHLFYNSGGLGITLGSYIIGGNEIRADANNWLFQHEYGHYLQSRASGPAYVSRYAIPSLFDKKVDKNNPKTFHKYNPVEQDANARSIQYFYKRNGSNFVWDFYYNPIGYPGNTRWSMTDYNSTEFQSLLKSLIIEPSAEDYIFPIINGFFNIGPNNANYVDYENIYYGPRGSY
jgi:RHS repeat-associated protein